MSKTNLITSDVYKDILKGKTSNYIIEKYVLHNVPYFFAKDMDLYFEIKKKISEFYSISITNIYLVGSGQFGFSMSSEKDYRDFVWEESTEELASDLDIAIISNKLFDEYWDGICDYNINKVPHDSKDEKLFNEFKNYLYKGWMRPDKFPFEYEKRKAWFNFFKTLQPLVNRKVAGGIFRNEICFIKKYRADIEELSKRIKEIK